MERKREREKERESVCMCMYVCECVCDCETHREAVAMLLLLTTRSDKTGHRDHRPLKCFLFAYVKVLTCTFFFFFCTNTGSYSISSWIQKQEKERKLLIGKTIQKVQERNVGGKNTLNAHCEYPSQAKWRNPPHMSTCIHTQHMSTHIYEHIHIHTTRVHIHTHTYAQMPLRLI